MPGKQHRKILPKSKLAKPVTVKTATGIPKWAPIAVLVFTALVYSNALYNGITTMDDDDYILRNPFIRDFSWHSIWSVFTSFYSSNYHPLTTLAWLFEYTFFKLNPIPYHLLNVLLHILNTWLVFKLTDKLSGKKTTALVASILFALHPMHVESVAWISELKDVLYAAFYLSALIVYLQYLASGRRGKNYTWALLLFVASLLSKSAAVTLPVLLVAIDIYKGRKVNAKSLAEKIPFFILSIVFGIVNIFAQRSGGPIVNLLSSYGVANGIFLFPSMLASYLIRSVAPFHLAAIHYLPNQFEHILPWAYYASLPFIVFIAWLVVSRNPFRIKNVMRKELIFGLSFFLIAISVMLQIVSVGSALTAERYTYIAYIGLFYIAGQWITYKIEQKNNSMAVISGFSLFVIVCSAITWDRIGVWKDDNVLFTNIIEKNPGILDVNFIYMLRGNYKTNTGDRKGAIEDYTKAIEMNPQFAFEYLTYYHRAQVYDESGDTRSALDDLNKSLQLNPKFALSYNSRGWIYFKSGDKTAAMADFDKAIELNPRYAEAYNNKGWVYDQSGDKKTAVLNYNKAIETDPAFPKPYYNRAAINAIAGNLTSAIEDYNTLIRLNPDEHMAYFYRGIARMNRKDNAGACSDWQKAAELGNERAPQMLQQYCH